MLIKIPLRKINNLKFTHMEKFKLILPLLLFFFATNLQAQKQLEKKAEKLSSEITKALELNEEEAKAVYNIQLERFKKANEIREKHKDDEATKKEELKKLGNTVFNQMKETLGKERMKKWNQYRKSTKNN